MSLVMAGHPGASPHRSFPPAVVSTTHNGSVNEEIQRAKKRGWDGKFHPDRIGIFDPDSIKNGKRNDHVDSRGMTHFHTVRAFIDAINGCIPNIPAFILRQNLQMCLTGTAATWY